MTQFRRDADTMDMAKALVYLADKPDEYVDDVEMCLHNLKAICENDRNFEFYRTTFDVIVEAIEALQRMEVIE